MLGDRDVIVFYDPRVLEHNPDIGSSFLPGRLEKKVREILASVDSQWTYPEDPDRILAIKELLDEEPIPGVRFESGALATPKQLARVHSTSYVDNIFELAGKNAWLDVDTTAVSPGSIKAARVAAGTRHRGRRGGGQGPGPEHFRPHSTPGPSCRVPSARAASVFSITSPSPPHMPRPPSIAKRVLIIDWDAHHGNGTQEIFWADPDVMFFDLHREAPFYPGTGLLDEVGGGLGEGTNVNIPLPGGAGNLPYIKALREILVPAADWFKPDLILVSAGFRSPYSRHGAQRHL